MTGPMLEQRSACPQVDEYRKLRVDCGLSPKSAQAAERGLPNSLFATTIRDGERLVAMGRVIGDGGCNLEIVDVAVHPDYQRRGLGSRVMAALMDWIGKNAPRTAYVSLIADDHSPALYSKFGFEPTTPGSIGMGLMLR